VGKEHVVMDYHLQSPALSPLRRGKKSAALVEKERTAKEYHQPIACSFSSAPRVRAQL